MIIRSCFVHGRESRTRDSGKGREGVTDVTYKTGNGEKGQGDGTP